MNAPSMLLSPMINFNLIKIVIFLMFHVHKNSKLNRFNYISKVENFRVLQSYPLKMNLVLEIRKMLPQKVAGMFFSDPLLFPK